MLDNLSALDVAGRLGLAIAMAVFMGLAFEGVYKREQHTCPGGIRTFPMLAALGGMLLSACNVGPRYVAPAVPAPRPTTTELRIATTASRLTEAPNPRTRGPRDIVSS